MMTLKIKVKWAESQREFFFWRSLLITSYSFNKTKDWAVVQTTALVINEGVKVRLGKVR